MAPKNKWLVGETVTVDLDGTPVEGIIRRAPYEGDDAWTDPTHTYWIVKVDGMGTFTVINGRVVGDA